MMPFGWSLLTECQLALEPQWTIADGDWDTDAAATGVQRPWIGTPQAEVFGAAAASYSVTAITSYTVTTIRMT
jgi:hypothetical protein